VPSTSQLHFFPDRQILHWAMISFLRTLGKSSLGNVVAWLVPTFHGHGHNRACRTSWHLLYVEGIGLEDFEECECTISKSNELASVTRLSNTLSLTSADLMNISCFTMMINMHHLVSVMNPASSSLPLTYCFR
jgi:hypothetical protein